MPWCSLGLLSALTFFASVNCVWTSRQQFSVVGKLTGAQYGSHWKNGDTQNWGHPVTETVESCDFSQRQALAFFTLLHHILCKSIQFLILYILGGKKNTHHETPYSRAIPFGVADGKLELTMGRPLSEGPWRQSTHVPRPLDLLRIESGSSPVSWTAMGNLPRLILLWPFFFVFCFLKKTPWDSMNFQVHV